MKRSAIFFVCLTLQMMAANPYSIWQREWDHGGTDRIHNIGLDWPGYLCYTGESKEGMILLNVGKLTTDGDSVWRSTYSEGFDAVGYDLVVLPNHHLAVIGTEASTGNPRSFSLRYSSDGTLIKTLQTPGRDIDGPPVVAARHPDSCYIGAWGENSLGNATRTSHYLLDSSWEVISSYSFNSGYTPLVGMVIDSKGFVYTIRPPCNLGMMTHDLQPRGYREYEGNPGEVLNVTGLTISSTDEIYCCGRLFDNPEQDFFLLKWNTLGAPIWGVGGHKRYDLDATEYCLDIALDAIADCYSAGYQLKEGEEDPALVKTDSAGAMLWSWVDTMPGKQEIEAIEVDSDGYIYLAGSHYNGSNWDMLIMKVRQPLTITGLVTDSLGKPMKGITVALSGDTTVEAVTDDQGRYSLEVYNGGNYMVKPKLSGWVFEPASRAYSPLAHRMINQDFLNGRWTAVTEEPTAPSVTLEVDDRYIRFALPQSSHVRLAIYDVCGRQVCVLAEGTYSAESHTFAKPDLEPGVYFVRLEGGSNFIRMRRFVSLRFHGGVVLRA